MVQTLLQALGIDRVTDTATTYCSSQGRGKVSPLQLIKKKLIFILGVWVFVCTDICAPYVRGAGGNQKRALDTLKLELQMIASCHVGSGILCKSNECP